MPLACPCACFACCRCRYAKGFKVYMCARVFIACIENVFYCLQPKLAGFDVLCLLSFHITKHVMDVNDLHKFKTIILSKLILKPSFSSSSENTPTYLNTIFVSLKYFTQNLRLHSKTFSNCSEHFPEKLSNNLHLTQTPDSKLLSSNLHSTPG